jgi:hypothetical protein
MFRFSLFMAGVMAASTGFAEDVSPCPGDTVPIQIMTPGRGGSGITRSVAKLSDPDPHFRAFVTAVTEHVAARLARDSLCIKGSENMENMKSAESNKRSLFQFVRWSLDMHNDFLVPALLVTGGVPIDCQISSPWIDLVVIRRPVPSIRGVVRWNERQLLTDQAILAGAHNAPQSMAMPLKPAEFGHFLSEYERPEAGHTIEERVPPDLLWLLRSFRPSTGGQNSIVPFIVYVENYLRKATEKGAEGYTKLVLALIDRCFAPNGAKQTRLYYNNILDAADLIPLEQYKIVDKQLPNGHEQLH